MRNCIFIILFGLSACATSATRSVDYWPNGNIKYKGPHVPTEQDGETVWVEHGTCREWYSNGQLKWKYKMRRGHLVGPEREWWDNGQLKKKGQRDKDSNPKGTWTWWDADGKVAVQCRFENGNGTQYQVGSNGVIRVMAPVVDGRFHGTMRIFDENGILSQEAAYVRGKFVEPEHEIPNNRSELTVDPLRDSTEAQP